MQNKRIADIAADIALPIAASQQIELWDVEFVKEGGEWFLRFFIDSPDGVDIEMCERFSRAVDAELDNADPIEAGYNLEVSSPGIERVLKTDSHLSRYIGEMVTVKLYKAADNSKKHIGRLVSFSGSELILENITLDRANIAQVRVWYDFNAQ